jgi:cytosine/adenosine deaminase-related metal-dependent hydrolase
MTKKLFKNIEVLGTFDRNHTELTQASLLVEDQKISALGTDFHVNESEMDEIIDCTGKVVIPGFVNTHHHLYQSLFRNVRGVQNAKLFDWLTFLYEKWKFVDARAIASAARVGIYEMMLSGVTTTSDMFYLYPFNQSGLFDVEVETARETGIRFHPCRGSMSLSKKDGGLPPDSVVQTDEVILEESKRVIRKYHDPEPFAMTRIALAPCSPFSVSEKLMLETLELAKKENVLIHTHLAETRDEEHYCLERFGLTPVALMEKLGWLNPFTWFAHCVWLTKEEIMKFAENGVGVSHCPSSNMRLGSGIAPIAEMADEPEIRLSLAVDGSASNDTGNMLEEIRNCVLLQRVTKGADALEVKKALEFASLGGARVLNREKEIGTLEVGKAADFIGFSINRLEFAGGLSDPIAALVLCDAKQVDFSVINGEFRVREGAICGVDVTAIVEEQNRISKELLSK